MGRVAGRSGSRSKQGVERTAEGSERPVGGTARSQIRIRGAGESAGEGQDLGAQPFGIVRCRAGGVGGALEGGTLCPAATGRRGECREQCPGLVLLASRSPAPRAPGGWRCRGADLAQRGDGCCQILRVREGDLPERPGQAHCLLGRQVVGDNRVP